jgi:transcriptional regulator with XRE-family HTH domain
MAMRKCGPLDAMVGARIRMFRIHRGMSEAAFAERIGVTFQQAQKYELGTHRAGVSRLSRIATVLGISVGELFESSAAGSTSSRGLKSPMRQLGKPGVLNSHNERTINPRPRPGFARLSESSADRPCGGKTAAPPLDGAGRGERRRFPFH